MCEYTPIHKIVSGNDSRLSQFTPIYNTFSGNGSEYVSIHPSTGLMTIAKRIDCDTAKIRVLNMELTVTDRGGLQTNTSFTVTVVDINDNAPTCFSPISRMSVRENGTKSR